MLKNKHINISFADALAWMPKYAKFVKKISQNKKRLEEHKTVMLNEKCSAILLNKLPPKLKKSREFYYKNPESFTISCLIGNSFFEKTLCISVVALT